MHTDGRMKPSRILGLLLVIPFALVTVGEAAAGRPTKVSKSSFQKDMRKLWEDHVTWTRLYIVSATAKLPETDATAERLMKNQKDIGDAMKPIYGEDAGAKLTELLTDHIKIASEIVTAAMAKDDAKKNDAVKRWQTNADDIATFLNKANPKQWPLAEMKKMMREHLDKTTEELVAHLSKDWEKDIAAYDAVHTQILGMADMLSAGIIKQFPKKFR